ncbi:MAG: hypothetical protein LBH00_05525 [Planctomycetaceae bacterium]|jgi:hypothetical protein|nr:hypothetical protein [Planctomycetaceae bacterium]
MIIIFCTTCGAKLTVKNDALIGKIVACPKCKCLLQVPRPVDAITPTIGTLRKPPDVPANESANTVPPVSDAFQSSAPTATPQNTAGEEACRETELSDTEIKTRKLLLGILFFLVFLLLVLGYFVLFTKKEWSRNRQQVRPAGAVEKPNPAPHPAPSPVSAEPALPEPVSPKPAPAQTDAPVLPPEDAAVPKISVRLTDDSAAGKEKNGPALIEHSVQKINIAAKLELPVAELHVDNIALVHFIRFFSRMTGVPMTLDIDAVKLAGLSADSPVSGEFRDQTAASVLTQILDSLHLQWMTADRQILIVPKEDTGKMPDVLFDVSDFSAKTEDLKPAVLADRIQKIVCPGEKITVLPDNMLTVVQAKTPHRTFIEIQKFLEQLRVLRHLPQKTEWTGEQLAPETFGWDEVMKPLTLNYYQPVPLAQIISRLEDRTKLIFLIDHRAFQETLLPFNAAQASVQCNQGTLNSVLEWTLHSVEAASLTYRIIDAKTLEITSAEYARQKDRMTAEIHLCRLQEGKTLEDIALSLRSAVEPESWVRADAPETIGGGEIVTDTPSGCLLIRQSQPAQRQIRLYLDAKEPEM